MSTLRGGRGGSECVATVVGIGGDQKESKITIPVKSLTTLKEQIGFNEEVSNFLNENKEMKKLSASDFNVQIWNSTKNKFKTLKNDKDIAKYLTLFKAGVKIVIVSKFKDKEKSATTRSSLANIYRKSLQQFSFGKGNAEKRATQASPSSSSSGFKDSLGGIDESSNEFQNGRPDSDPSFPTTNERKTRFASESEGTGGKSNSSRNLLNAPIRPRNSMSISLPSSPQQPTSPPAFKRSDASTPRGSHAQQSLFGTQRAAKDPGPKKWKGPLFGQPIAEVVEKQEGTQTIPHIVTECVAWLRAKEARNEEGLFRISGSSVEIEELRKEYDRKGTMDLSEKDHSIHVISGLLKSYFREMPEPVIVYRYYVTALRVAQNPNPEIQKNNLKAILTKLPPAHRDVLLFMCSFLKEVAEKSDINKMHVHNIALIWGPNFLRNYAHLTTPMNQLTEADSVNGLIRLMIEEADFFLPLMNAKAEEEPVISEENTLEKSASQRARSSTTNSSMERVKSPLGNTLTIPPKLERTSSKREVEARIGELKKDLQTRKSLLDLRKKVSSSDLDDPEAKMKALEARFPSECLVIAKFDYERAGIKLEEYEDLSMKRGEVFQFKKIKPEGNTLWLLVQNPHTESFGLILPGHVVKKTSSTIQLDSLRSSQSLSTNTSTRNLISSTPPLSEIPSSSSFKTEDNNNQEIPAVIVQPEGKPIGATNSLDSFVPVDEHTEWEEKSLLLERDILAVDERQAELDEIRRVNKDSDLFLIEEEENQLRVIKELLLEKKLRLDEEGKSLSKKEVSSFSEYNIEKKTPLSDGRLSLTRSMQL
eukprot:TRINITY_DN1311_c0_g1_i2.p1 TRINITY_DN1311_c0_g1~~TRINITY_DN1311_c0_g1_i2.p1  ORF type:complete len:818 (+),score=347.09 TRINITY_DN1311_c0_g1_i2:307-2760(+)